MATTKQRAVVVFGDARLPARFWSKVVVSAGGCWMWTASQRRGGYGRFRAGPSTRVAHRVSYEALVEHVSDGMQLDHLCRVRLCCNPSHLEPVTPRENTMRGETSARANAGKTHCPRGHKYDEANTYRERKRHVRQCKACRTLLMRGYRAARRAA